MTCPYCKGKADLVDSKVIYKRVSYGMAWLCKPCDAYVGCHYGTNKPLGRLANKELRQWKMKAHHVFDPLWKTGKLSRNRAYSVLAEKLEMDIRKCHIGMFDVEECKKVVEIFEQGEI